MHAHFMLRPQTTQNVHVQRHDIKIAYCNGRYSNVHFLHQKCYFYYARDHQVFVPQTVYRALLLDLTLVSEMT